MKHENNRSKHFKKVLITQQIQKLVWVDKLSVEEYRLQAVSLLSWSVEQNARDTQMTTRVTGDARRERRLAASLLFARARVHSPY